MSTTITEAPRQTIDREVLADLCAAAGLDPSVINMDTTPEDVRWRPEGIWIDADSTKTLTVAVAVLGEAIGQGAGEAFRQLEIRRHSGGSGGEPSYEARLPGWALAWSIA